MTLIDNIDNLINEVQYLGVQDTTKVSDPVNLKRSITIKTLWRKWAFKHRIGVNRRERRRVRYTPFTNRESVYKNGFLKDNPYILSKTNGGLKKDNVD